MSQTINWDVRRERDTVVVVELPRGLELDGKEGQAINEAFFEAISHPQARTVLTLLRVENALGSGLFEEVKRGADAAAENDIGHWAIVVEQRVKGMAFDSQISGLDTRVFEDEQAAREWLADDRD
jgi:hypothetical protein